MYTKQEIIIRYLREGKSQREISRVLQISRKTVKKYIEGYFSSQKEAGKGEENLHEDLSKRPKYNCPKRPKRALTEEISAQIDQLLEDNFFSSESSIGDSESMLKRIQRQGA
jgi:transposase